MKKVPTYLLDILLAASEGQTVAPFDPIGELYGNRIQIVDNRYQKTHSVPEGLYVVKLLDIKCHSTTCFYMEVQILREMGKKAPYENQPIIDGYARRYYTGFTDLYDTFEDGIAHKSTKGYIGNIGLISLTSSGWINLMPRHLDRITFPNAAEPMCKRLV